MPGSSSATTTDPTPDRSSSGTEALPPLTATAATGGRVSNDPIPDDLMGTASLYRAIPPECSNREICALIRRNKLPNHWWDNLRDNSGVRSSGSSLKDREPYCDPRGVRRGTTSYIERLR